MRSRADPQPAKKDGHGGPGILLPLAHNLNSLASFRHSRKVIETSAIHSRKLVTLAKYSRSEKQAEDETELLSRPLRRNPRRL